VEDFELVEADFQQYYSIDLDSYYKNKLSQGKGFWRYSRLFSELPLDSRIIKKTSPTESWQYDQEWQMLTLQQLRDIYSILYNTNRKKGSKTYKPDEPFQPDYMKKAREEYQKMKKESDDIDDDSKRFWQERTGIEVK
jgi:hypothetical protein